MKKIICYLITSLFYFVLADVKNAKESVPIATDKSSDSKPKRDLSLLKGAYHGPSYKYLPPSVISSSYDSYSGSAVNPAEYSGRYISGIGGGYRGAGHGQSHHGVFSHKNHNSPIFHNFVYTPALSYSTSQHGSGFPSSNQYAGHGSPQLPESALFNHGDFHRPHSSAADHSYSSSGSGIGYKPHSLVEANGGSGSGYYYSKGLGSGSFSSPPSSGFGSVQDLGSSLGSALNEEHHGDHVHNGAQEHVYITSKRPTTGFVNLHDSASVVQQGSHVDPTSSYLSSGKQYNIPITSYGKPTAAFAGSHDTKYHSQTPAVIKSEPAYATGHKGLGYYSFAANKPQVLHASISRPSYNQPTYSKAPFKPSLFLGAKIEDSAHNDAASQQYLPPLEVGSDSTSYDYPIPSGPSMNYQEPGYQQALEVQPTSLNEPDSSYLPPKNTIGSLNEISSAPSENYLPPSNSYGVPYSH